MIIQIDCFKNDSYRSELIIWQIQFLFRHQLQERIQSKQMIIKMYVLVIFLLRSNLVNCNQDDLKNYQQNRDSIIQSLVVKGTLVISIILTWEFTLYRSISTKQIETNPFIMRIFFRFESVIHWGKKWFFVQMTHFWKEIVEIYFLNSSISNSNF